jgi:adenine-specific DNA-methyltransferase
LKAQFERLRRCLWKLLGGEQADLDFGVYRMINAARDEIERFLGDELPAQVESIASDEFNEQQIVECLHGFFITCLDHVRFHVHSPGRLPGYAFRLPSGRRVVFERVEKASAQERDASSQPKVRVDVLASETPIVVNQEELRITFESREVATGQKQATVNQKTLSAILGEPSVSRWIDELGRCVANSGKRKISLLERHLAAFTLWHEQEFRIYPDVTKTLSEGWDAHLQQQLLPFEVLAGADVDVVSQRLELLNPLRRLGAKIVERVVRREGLLEAIWQAPRTIERYECLTLDRVPAELYPEIAANADQREAWQEWFAINELPDYSSPLSIEFLRAHPSLVLDARWFDDAFRRLLNKSDNFDEAHDGLLIESENLQALQTYKARFAGRVKCIFIDPPYNTGVGVWAYADRFGHEQWVAMMRDRLELAHEWLADDGAIFISLDDHEQARLRLLLDDIFGEENFLATIIWEKVHTRKNSARHFSVSHDYIIAFAKDKSRWQRQLIARPDTDAYGNPDGDPRGLWKPDPIYANKPYGSRYSIRKPNGVTLEPPPGRYWRFSEANFLAKAARGEVLWGEDDAYPLVKRYLADVQTGLVPTTLFTRAFAGDNAMANAELRALFGAGRPVSYPKPSRLIERILEIATTPGGEDIVLDFFAGSGTTGQAVINLNRRDGGRRKYVLIEQADYFCSVLVPRLTKTVYASQWQAGRPTSQDGISQAFQYVRLETFEEALCREDVSR